MAESSSPLASFDWYMLADDRPSHPMTYFFRLNLTGRVDLAALEGALDTCLQRHPLLQSLVHYLPFGRECEWRQTDARPFVSDAEADVPLDFPRGEPIDLRSEVGLRVWIRNGPASSALWLQFHHCCCDGLGAFRFIEDLLACYGLSRTKKQSTDVLRPIDTSRLATRGNFGPGWAGIIKSIPRELLGIAGAVKFFLQRPLSLFGGRSAETAQPLRRHEALCSYRVSDSMARRLRRVAHDRGATLNDLLLRDFFLAFDDWISDNQPAVHGRPVRIMIPMNLRQPADEATPAANIVTMEFLDRNAHDCKEPEKMLDSIRDETRRSKTWRLGLRLIRVVGFVRALGLDLGPLLGERDCLATSVFSNLGNPLAKTPLPHHNGWLIAGDVILESIDIVPPLRPQTNVTLVVMAYGGELRFSLHYDARTISTSGAEDLLLALARRLEASAGDFPSRPLAAHVAAGVAVTAETSLVGAQSSKTPHLAARGIPAGT